MTVLEIDTVRQPVSKKDEWREEAKLVARDIMRHWSNPEYRMAFIMGLGELYGNLLEHHDAEIRVALRQAVERHLDTTRRSIVKSYIRTTLKQEFAKAGEDWSQAQRMRQRQRSRGRYISYESPFRRVSIGPPIQGPQPQHFDAGSQAQQAAALHRAFARHVGAGQAGQRVRFHILDSDGNLRVSEPTTGSPKMDEGERIVGGAGAGYAEPHTVGESVFNVAQALGVIPENAGAAAGVAHHFNNIVSEHSWGPRVQAIGNALGMASKGSPGIDVAAEMFKLVGQHGPEATKVLQPHMRRAMYRYRGIEAEDTQMAPVARHGRRENESLDGFRRRLAMDLYKKLPSNQEINLMIQSGQMPPSRGYLLDRRGRVVSEAAGEHDDHYLPFNLKNLGALNRGSYVRSRAYGGPSVEDLHVGLATGADKAVIVSRAGIYEVEFAHRVQRKQEGKTKSRLGYRELSGTYRDHGFGDPTKVMTKRYARLLDAISAGRISDPDQTGKVVQPADIKDEELPNQFLFHRQDGTVELRRGVDMNNVNRVRREIAERKTAKSRDLTLNGHGYDVALRSLQQQYPYFIRNIKYTPATTSMGGRGVRAGTAAPQTSDSGYVRPYHLKPKGTVADWHDDRLRPSGAKDHARTFDEIEGYAWGIARRNRPDGGGGSGGVGGSTPRPTPGGTPTPSGGRSEPGQAPNARFNDPLVQTQNDAGAGSQRWSATEKAEADHRRQVNTVVNTMGREIGSIKPDALSGPNREFYEDIKALRDQSANAARLRATGGVSDQEREKAARSVERAKDLRERLYGDPDALEELMNFVRVATAQPGLPFTPVTNFGIKGDAPTTGPVTGVALNEWVNTSGGQKFNEARKNARWIALKRRVDNKQALKPDEMAEWRQLNEEWNRAPSKDSPTRSLYTSEEGNPLTPRAFWNVQSTDENGNDQGTEYHRYTNDEDENGETAWERHYNGFVSAYRATHGESPPLNRNQKTTTVFDYHAVPLEEKREGYRPKVRAEQTVSDAAARLAQAEQDLAESGGDKSSYDEAREAAESADDEMAQQYANMADSRDALDAWDDIDFDDPRFGNA